MAERNGEIIPIAPVAAKVSLKDLPAAERYILIALNRLEKQLGPVVRKIRDVSRPVDEYSTESVLIDNITTVSVFPEYTHMAERIESVIVTGPPSTAFTLTLGDRVWDVLTNTSGLFEIHGAGLLMSFNDARLLTATVTANPVPVQPAVPVTNFPQQNTNNYPVQVVINANGATVNSITVNGVIVGNGAGTYVVPAYGSIAMAYTVATPTWVWSDANPTSAVAGNWTLELTGFADERYFAA